MAGLQPREDVERLFLELSSESRLDILRLLETKELRMGELARRLHLTATEATRQLKRMTDALLVQRLPAGAYTDTPYGRLILQLSPSLEFVSRHREYFSTRDLSRLPFPLVDRIGELSQETLALDTMENIRKGERMMGEARQYFWALVPGPGNDLLTPVVDEQVGKGVHFRFVVPKDRLAPSGPPSGTPEGVEVRAISDIPVILALTEKEAFVAFLPIGGRWDYAGFHGHDPRFLTWAKDVFLHYWDRTTDAPLL